MDQAAQPDLVPNRVAEIRDQIERLMEEMAALTPDAPLIIKALEASFGAKCAVIRLYC